MWTFSPETVQNIKNMDLFKTLKSYSNLQTPNLDFSQICQSHLPWLDFPISTKNFAGLNCPDWLQERGCGPSNFLYIFIVNLEYFTNFFFFYQYFILCAFLKWLVPLTLINSHCPINTPKKLWVPNLFVGCDSESVINTLL